MVYEEMVLTTIYKIMTTTPTGDQLHERLLDLSAESRMLEREYFVQKVFSILESHNTPKSALRELEEWFVREEIPALKQKPALSSAGQGL